MSIVNANNRDDDVNYGKTSKTISEKANITQSRTR